MLTRIRNTPNLAGAVLAVLAFVAAMLILPMFEKATPEVTLGLSAAIAAVAFHKGKRAVENRLKE